MDDSSLKACFCIDKSRSILPRALTFKKLICQKLHATPPTLSYYAPAVSEWQPPGKNQGRTVLRANGFSMSLAMKSLTMAWLPSTRLMHSLATRAHTQTHMLMCKPT